MFLLKRVKESRFFSFNVSTQHRGESERESWPFLPLFFSLFIVSYAVLLNFSVSLFLSVFNVSPRCYSRWPYITLLLAVPSPFPPRSLSLVNSHRHTPLLLCIPSIAAPFHLGVRGTQLSSSHRGVYGKLKKKKETHLISKHKLFLVSPFFFS